MKGTSFVAVERKLEALEMSVAGKRARLARERGSPTPPTGTKTPSQQGSCFPYNRPTSTSPRVRPAVPTG